MKIAFPTKGYKGFKEKIFSHFGSAPTFTVVESKSGKVKTIKNEPQPEKEIFPPDILVKNKVDVVIAPDLGEKAIQKFKDYKIKMFKAAPGEKIADLVKKYNNGELKRIKN